MTKKPRAMGSHHSARMGKDEWLTPPSILQALGPFDLDPCAPISPPWRTASRQFSIQDDGLAQPWEGFVWLNPPYGAEASRWLDRLADHGDGIALIFARTETESFFRDVWKRASALLFIEGRLYFHHVSGERAHANSGAPSVLVGYGSEAARRLSTCSIPGAFVSGWTFTTGPRP